MDYKKIPIFGFIISWMNENDMDYGPFVTIVALMLLVVGLFVFGFSAGQVFVIIIVLAPIWLPILLFFTFFYKWMEVVGKKFWLNQGRVTLRIKLPQEIMKSPETMETVLAQIHNTASPDNLMQTYLDGKRPLTFSLEIVSIGGEVRFYVNVPRRKTKDAFEANMYAQYPGIEIVEEPVDYAAEIPLDTEEYDVFAVHMGKKEQEELPLKTYIDFGLDKMPKEEEKTDPITPTLEVLASIKPYERLYVQYLCTPYRKDSFKNGQLFASKPWKARMAETVDAVMRRDPKTKAPLNNGTGDDDDGSGQRMTLLTGGERGFAEVLERHSGKYPYSTAIRWLYVTKKGHFNGDLINPVIRMFSQYDSGANAIGVKWRTDFNYAMFTDPNRKRIDKLKKTEFREFKLRKYDPKNGDSDAPKVFTVEELATVFHLPGRVAITPNLARIPSTRSEAPPNLPVGEPAE